MLDNGSIDTLRKLSEAELEQRLEEVAPEDLTHILQPHAPHRLVAWDADVGLTDISASALGPPDGGSPLVDVVGAFEAVVYVVSTEPTQLGVPGPIELWTWDVATGQSRRVSPAVRHGLVASGDGELVPTVDVSRDGRRLVSIPAVHQDGVEVWTVATGHIDEVRVGSPSFARFSSDGERLLVCGEGVRVWDFAERHLLDLEGASGCGIRFGPGGRAFAYTTENVVAGEVLTLRLHLFNLDSPRAVRVNVHSTFAVGVDLTGLVAVSDKHVAYVAPREGLYVAAFP